MAETKTRATAASVDQYLAARATEEQRADCESLMAMMHRVTGERPRMWGPSIVGYGTYEYVYESGRQGRSCLTGFAVRGREIVVYLVGEDAGQDRLLAKLGKHRMGRACLYFRRLDDLDRSVLERLIVGSVAAVERRHRRVTESLPAERSAGTASG